MTVWFSRISVGGSRVRIVLSNEYGKTPLTIGAAEIALAGEGGAIKEGSGHPVTFGGNPTMHPNAAGYQAMGGAIDLNTMTTN
jgi:hypothetical protein